MTLMVLKLSFEVSTQNFGCMLGIFKRYRVALFLEVRPTVHTNPKNAAFHKRYSTGRCRRFADVFVKTF